MPQLTPDHRPPRRGRAGLTLIEVLVTITILAIVGGLLSATLTRQQRFYRDAAETIDVRRELRGSASLIPTDLRALSTVGGDLLTALPTQFDVRASIGSGVVCARPSATEVDLAPTGLANHTLTSWHTQPLVGDQVFVFDEGALTGEEDDSWWGQSITGIAESVAYCATTPFVHTAADALQRRYRLSFATPVPASVAVGAVVRFTRPVRYAFYQAASMDWYLGYAERRSGAWTPVQPIAGPLTASDGVRFTYFDTLGTALTPVSTEERSRVARIDVMLHGQGRSDALRLRGGRPYQDSLLFRVGIRNYR